MDGVQREDQKSEVVNRSGNGCLERGNQEEEVERAVVNLNEARKVWVEREEEEEEEEERA